MHNEHMTKAHARLVTRFDCRCSTDCNSRAAGTAMLLITSNQVLERKYAAPLSLEVSVILQPAEPLTRPVFFKNSPDTGVSLKLLLLRPS